uniref:Putative LAGLIDADG homing endonuclease n=1 Tax=Coleochaete scutata TaxID=3125 RepID=A0A5P9NVX7_COLSC|nr:putative LAGLIDADG homing endonuclease [Coleochaete scutata]QFU80111.1 putative LAGLIDADG homing endonuclease [Coleochaete scutata]QIQ23019.1 putative LAGLIDADG homing endonuclease [Coleochaete scutata]
MKKKQIEDMKTVLTSQKQINLSRKKLKQIPLSDQCKEIILGSLLGDGSLQIPKNDKNARFFIRHSQVEEEYFEWKASALEEISSDASIKYSEKSGYSENQKLLFQSGALGELTEIHSITHNGGHGLIIRRRWLNHLTPLSLAIWWLDDGSIISRGRKGVLCTDGFDEDSVKLLANYLEVVWNVYTHVGPIKRDRKDGNCSKKLYYRLWFGTEELKKFLRIILPYVPVKSMLRKAMLLYKDAELQQRWISEMKLLNPNFSEEIDLILQSKQKLRE